MRHLHKPERIQTSILIHPLEPKQEASVTCPYKVCCVRVLLYKFYQVFDFRDMTSLNLRFEETENYSQSAHQLCAILLSYFDPKKPTPLHSTAASILRVLPKNKPESTEVWMFGELCIELAEQVPYHHPFQLKLVGLLEYLQLSPHLGRTFEDVDKNVSETD